MSKSPPDHPIHTLEALTTTLGEATLEEVLPFVEGHDKAALVDDGARVVTSRISTDAARMYGNAFDFLAHATSEQLDHLPIFSRSWLRIAVWAATEGDRRYADLSGQSAAEAAKQDVATAKAGASRDQIEAKRDQLHTALVSFAGGDSAHLTEVKNAYGSVADLAGAVSAQAGLVKKWRLHPSRGMKARMKDTRLTDAWLAKAEKLAGEYDTAAKRAAATRSKGPTTQADVDYVDGINLVLLQSAAAQFEAGHAADATIPRLTFNALRSHVQRAHRAAPAPATPPTEP
jgi:hypothetical protein